MEQQGTLVIQVENAVSVCLFLYLLGLKDHLVGLRVREGLPSSRDLGMLGI